MTEEHESGLNVSSGRTLQRALVVSIAVVAMMFVAAAVIAGVVRGSDPEPEGLVFTIPSGSKSLVLPQLESAIKIPTDIVFLADDDAAITIINEDDVTHRAGPFLVGPNQTFIQRFDSPGSYPIACPVDPAESIVVTVRA